jgi:hypothetical protein
MKNKIVWIDDRPDREPTARDLGADFINVKDVDLAPRVAQLLNGPPPRLVILDHILDQTTTPNPVFKRGSTIAEAIKEKWPACAVVGVTAANVQGIDLRTRRTYDELFSFVDLGKYLDRIESMWQGFAKVSKAKAKKARDLMTLLKPPEDEIERLVAALPDDLKKSFRDEGVASRLYRWVDHLMDRPGFLYDSLWAATYLGLNEEGFEKVGHNFNNGQYSGVFARDDDDRWWTSRLAELLYKQCEQQSEEMSWHTGRRLPGIKERHYSRCSVCQNEYPETVAYLDEAIDERRAMHLKCTVLHPRYNRELYFEDIRMMRGN